MSDEARHVAFGVLSLKEYYAELTDAEMLERQEFAFEAAVRMRDRFLQQEVWERMGVDAQGGHASCVHATPEPAAVPAAALLQDRARTARSSACSTRNDGWLRKQFDELGVIQFEDWADTGEEYEAFALGDRSCPTPASPPDADRQGNRADDRRRRRGLGHPTVASGRTVAEPRGWGR